MLISKKIRFALAAAIAATALAVSGCAAADPLNPGGGPSDGASGSADTIVIGSQAYYSNEIIADAYMPSVEDGTIELFPEYTGNLLQWFDKDTTARTSDDVYAALVKVLPKGLVALDQSSATDQDSYNVTADFAEANNLKSLDDLAAVSVPLTLGGAPELEERPYGPKGLLELYGATVGFSATGDTTVEDLLAGTVNIANVYSADPRIQTDHLVTLADPKGLFLASNVVPIANAEIADEIADVINGVSAKLTPAGLVAMNVQSTVELQSPAVIATKWLKDNGLS